MSLIAKIALTSLFVGIILMLVSLILWLLDDFYSNDIWIPILEVGILLAVIPLIGLSFYLIGCIFIKIWT